MSARGAAERRILSARSTGFYHAVPVLWVAAVALTGWMVRSDTRLVAMLVPIGLAPALFLHSQLRKYRRISTDGESLYVSTGGGEVTVPFSEVEDVREIPGMGRNRVPTVVLSLRSDTPIGREIRFVPRMRWWPTPESIEAVQRLQDRDPDAATMALWGGLSVAEEIRQRADAARSPPR